MALLKYLQREGPVLKCENTQKRDKTGNECAKWALNDKHTKVGNKHSATQ